MVTEIKIDDTNGDFLEEMKNLVQEDTAQHLDTHGKQRIGEGEEARKAQGAPTAEPDLFHERALEEAEHVDMHEILARQMGIDYIDLDEYPSVDFKILRMVPADFVKQHHVFPLEFDSQTNVLTLAISNPSDPTVVDDLSLTLGCEIHAVLADEGDIVDRINAHYGLGEETLGTLLDEYGDQEEEENILEQLGDRVVDLTDIDEIIKSPPIVKLTALILMKAIQDHASDIHIEPFENMLRIRYRVDGVLREMDSPPKNMQLGLISRFKVLADLDIAETRRPQDGRINLSMRDNREVELRVTSVPTVHGESLVMRVLDRTVMQMGIHQIGMSQHVLENFLREVRKPNGIVLVTGPTGCGKTTTLYAAIDEIKDVADKLITTEDPVEYQVDGIIQVNIRESVGLTYARCLRAILRQDPDKILVGEIRDVDTARISVQSALTGHLVFSTLHTNSAAGTITRLIDMGIEPFLVTSTLQAVLGQRLVRTICPNCRQPHKPTEEELREFGVTAEDIADITFYQGAGCDDCYFTGYKGRMGLYEYLPITEEIADLILEQATTDDIHALAIKQGMDSLRQDGWLKICTGLTTFSEVASRTPTEELLLADDDSDTEAPLGPEADIGLPGVPGDMILPDSDEPALPGLD